MTTTCENIKRNQSIIEINGESISIGENNIKAKRKRSEESESESIKYGEQSVIENRQQQKSMKISGEKLSEKASAKIF